MCGLKSLIMKEYDFFRDIAARLEKYGINILPDVLDMYGFSPCEFPRLCEGKRFYLQFENGRYIIHRLDEWNGRAEFGKLLKAARHRLGLSVEEVAKLADFTPSTVRRMEAGSFSYSIDQAARVADVLKSDITLTPR